MSSTVSYETPVCRTLDPEELERDRRAALSPYLERLCAGAEAGPGDEETPTLLSVGESSLELADWERRVLRQYHGRADGEGRPWPVFLAEGLAFRAKCLERCGTPEPGASLPEPPAGHEKDEDLITEVGVGVALLQELQWSIDSLIHEGDLAIARKLTEFRNSVSQSLAVVRNWMGSRAYSRASERSADLVGSVPVMAPRPEATEPPEPREPPRRATARHRGRRGPDRRVRVDRRRGRSRLPRLLLLLALSLLAWGGTRLLLDEYQRPPRLTADRFGHLRVVRSVSGQAPGAEIVLDAGGWERMTPEKRQATADAIGSIVAHTHYHRVSLRTSQGVAVGEWRRDRGSSLIDSPAETP
jgi:hypothetical protein